MDIDINQFVDLSEVLKSVEVEKIEAKLKYIEFPIGQKIAINNYWFEISGVDMEKNLLILKPISMTNTYKKLLEKARR